MATTTSRPSTPSASLFSKTYELSELFRGRQHSSVLPSSANSSKRKIPLFGLRKKSPAARADQCSRTLTPVPTSRPSTNADPPSELNPAQPPLSRLAIPSTSTPPPSLRDACSERSSISPTNLRSTRSITRQSSSQTLQSLKKSRIPTPTSSAALGGSISDSGPLHSSNDRVRTPTLLLRSYASDDGARKYLSPRILPPAKPPPTIPLPPTPEDNSTDFGTPTTPGVPNVSLPGQIGPYDVKSPTPSGRETAMSKPRSPSHKFTSVGESASKPAHGYTCAEYRSANGSEYTAAGLDFGLRNQTRSKQGSGNSSTLTSRATLVRAGLSSSAGSDLSQPPAKSPAIPLPKSSPSVLPMYGRTVSPRPAPPSRSSAKPVSPPLQSALKPSGTPGEKQREPGTTRSSLSRGSSESSRQASGQSSSSTSSSESSTRTLTIHSTPISASNVLSSSGNGSICTSTLVPPTSSTALSASLSSPAIVTTASRNSRRLGDERQTCSLQSGTKRSSPTVPSPPVHSRLSTESLPYASPSSFSASTSTVASQPPSSSRPSSSPQPSPSHVILPISPTHTNVFALQAEIFNLRVANASLHTELNTMVHLAERRGKEIDGLRWLLTNGRGEMKEEFGFTAFAEHCPSGEGESKEEV